MSYRLFDETNQMLITPLLESFWLRIYFDINTGSRIEIHGADFAIYQSVSSQTAPRPGNPNAGQYPLRLTDWNDNSLVLGPLTYLGRRGIDFGNELGRLDYFTANFTTTNPRAFLQADGWAPIFGAPRSVSGGQPLLVKKLSFGNTMVNRPVFMADETRDDTGSTHLRLALPCLSPPLAAAVLGAHGGLLEQTPFQLDVENAGDWLIPQPGSLSNPITGCTILAQGAFKSVLATDLDRWLNPNRQMASLAQLGELMALVSRAPATPRTLATCSDVDNATIVSGRGDLPVEALVLAGLTGQGANSAVV